MFQYQLETLYFSFEALIWTMVLEITRANLHLISTVPLVPSLLWLENLQALYLCSKQEKLGKNGADSVCHLLFRKQKFPENHQETSHYISLLITMLHE